jgi:hypothetical protein
MTADLLNISRAAGFLGEQGQMVEGCVRVPGEEDWF